MAPERHDLAGTNMQVGQLIADLRSFQAVAALAMRDFDSARQVQATITATALGHYLGELFGWSAQRQNGAAPLPGERPSMGATLQALPADPPGLPSQLRRLVRQTRRLESRLAADTASLMAA